jgi:hypothetical protein
LLSGPGRNQDVATVLGHLVNSLAGDSLVGRLGQLEPHLVWIKCEAHRYLPGVETGEPLSSKVDPDALKIAARRAECSLAESALSPFQAEPTHPLAVVVSESKFEHEAIASFLLSLMYRCQ